MSIYVYMSISSIYSLSCLVTATKNIQLAGHFEKLYIDS